MIGYPNKVLLPASASPDAARLISARALRGFADGMVSVLLPAYLTALGYSPVEIGAIATATLLGSAAVTLGTGLLAHRLPARVILLAACALMLATGLGFAEVTRFAPLLVVAFVGTLNPTAGDVSLFLPIEQSLLATSVAAEERTALYARYNVAAAGAAALGALASASPEWIARTSGIAPVEAMRLGFLVYAAVSVAVAGVYLGLDRTAGAPLGAAPRRPLERSRGIVLRLAALFTLDSFGGGFVAQSLLALWLFERFQFSLATAASFFFVATLLSGLSQLVSPRLAARIGLIRTMVYTHIPANLFLMLAALMPTAPLAVGFLFLRMALSSMDVPARQAFVMAVVPPEERAAAASVTNVPRSLGTGLAPLLAGWLLAHSSFGWPLLVGGALKIVYDLLLLAQFRHHEPPAEIASAR
jgi:MFS family permease